MTEIERLKAELDECRKCLIREGMERDDARNAAREIYAAGTSLLTFVERWPWLKEKP